MRIKTSQQTDVLPSQTLSFSHLAKVSFCPHLLEHLPVLLRFRDLLLVEFTNKLVVALTLGFMFPWAAIRTAKLRADAVKVAPAGDPDAFVAAAQPPVGAVGDSANDFFDFDIGFGA